MAAPARIAVTCGDPAGIGPEVIVQWLHDHPEDRVGIGLFGPFDWLEGEGSALDVALEPVGPVDFKTRPGQPSPAGAAVALAAMEAAAQGCLDGRYEAVVTGPVSKHEMAQIGFPFPGQTEFFAHRWGGEPTMAFLGRELRMVLATWHDPFSRVPELLRDPRRLARAVRRAARLCQALGLAQPRLAVCGLNPHAGENGLMGGEELDYLDPQLDRLRPEYPGLSRTLPADTVFWRMRQGEFDAVIALYHDQGLGPLKTIEFEHAVNITLGLPHIRTSPDHGTAFTLAGQGRASSVSFGAALSLARRLASFPPRPND